MKKTGCQKSINENIAWTVSYFICWLKTNECISAEVFSDCWITLDHIPPHNFLNWTGGDCAWNRQSHIHTHFNPWYISCAEVREIPGSVISCSLFCSVLHPNNPKAWPVILLVKISLNTNIFHSTKVRTYTELFSIARKLALSIKSTALTAYILIMHSIEHSGRCHSLHKGKLRGDDTTTMTLHTEKAEQDTCFTSVLIRLQLLLRILLLHY